MGGSPFRDCDVDVKRAQSRGEWLGVSCTFFEGFVGMAECVGGGNREEDACDVGGPRLGRDERGTLGGAMSPPPPPPPTAGSRGGALLPPLARCAELRAGKAARRGCEVFALVVVERFPALCAEFAAGKRGGWSLGWLVGLRGRSSSWERLKDGIIPAAVVADARGVVGEDGFLKVGGGGGGIIFLSLATFAGGPGATGSVIFSMIVSSTMLGITRFSSCPCCFTDATGASLPLVDGASCIKGRCSQVEKSHVVGGCL